MATTFYSGMKGPHAIQKLNELWDAIGDAEAIIEAAATVETSAAAAATSESNAATSEANAATSETNAFNSASAASAAQAATELIFDQFGDQYLGPLASDPTTDNDGDPLNSGDIYWNTTSNVLKFYTGTAWVAPETVATTAASNAATSEANAATSESNAATSASNASTSETNAFNSASSASTSASNASTSAGAAATSASNASTSASNAATSESNASGFATAAGISATNASNSAGAASTSASNAATSASNAATSESNAESSFIELDQKYLGAFSSPPTTNNQSGAIDIGALYWNTTGDALYIRDSGNNWNAAAFALSSGVASFNTRIGAVTLNSSDVTTALGYTPYNSTNPSGYTTNTGTVTSVSGTGTVSGLTLSGTVTGSGSLTLGGAITGFQETLVSGTSIKTVNGNSLLGSGDVSIAAGISTGKAIAMAIVFG